MARLTATSYGVLGLLAMRPWSAYELTKEIRRSLSLCWPRAETRIYQEPKNLVRLGLISATQEATGRRSRTVYTITDTGRQALSEWLDEPSAPPVFESEGILRVVFAEHGTREALLNTLGQLERDARALQERTRQAAPQYLEKVGVTPERLAHLELAGRFVNDYLEVLATWALEAQAEASSWPHEWPDAAQESSST